VGELRSGNTVLTRSRGTHLIAFRYRSITRCTAVLLGV